MFLISSESFGKKSKVELDTCANLPKKFAFSLKFGSPWIEGSTWRIMAISGCCWCIDDVYTEAIQALHTVHHTACNSYAAIAALIAERLINSGSRFRRFRLLVDTRVCIRSAAISSCFSFYFWARSSQAVRRQFASSSSESLPSSLRIYCQWIRLRFWNLGTAQQLSVAICCWNAYRGSFSFGLTETFGATSFESH